MKTYLNGAACISVQPSFLTDFWDENTLESLLPLQNDEVAYALEPAYKPYIAPNASRRMAKGVKMSVAAATEALKEAQIASPEAIFVGTGMGCLQDSEKFLTALLNNEEQHLTPTAFIQSTHNTVAGYLALLWQCKGENLTYVNGASSFEAALLAAKMQMEQDLIYTALVGGVDEHAPYWQALYEQAKINQQAEGAAFFALSNQLTDNTYAELVEVALHNDVTAFLQRHGLTLNDISLVLTGIPEAHYAERPVLYYKNLSGEYYTASAFGLWLACQILKHQQLPPFVRSTLTQPIKYLLLANAYQNTDFSLVLLTAPTP